MDATVEISIVRFPEHNWRLHSVPLGDLHIHAAQMCCWCFPIEVEPRVVVHNAKDTREARERAGYTCGKPWAQVIEYFIPDPA